MAPSSCLKRWPREAVASPLLDVVHRIAGESANNDASFRSMDGSSEEMDCREICDW